MVDVHNPEKRSFNMSRIRSKDTKPELVVRKFLHSKGFRYRLHVKDLKGTPDIVLPKFKTVIFIHGCFWHGHENCSYYVIPKTKTEWWLDKINSNINRDKIAQKILVSEGWRVITIWECELKKTKREETLSHLLESF